MIDPREVRIEMERHRMDPLSLSFGVGFAAAGIALLTTDLGLSDLHPRSWWPIPVLFLGGWLLLAALNRTRERDDRSLIEDAGASAEDEGAAASELSDYSFDETDDDDETEPVVRTEEPPNRPTA
jgi:hypothetical protein